MKDYKKKKILAIYMTEGPEHNIWVSIKSKYLTNSNYFKPTPGIRWLNQSWITNRDTNYKYPELKKVITVNLLSVQVTQQALDSVKVKRQLIKR